MGALAHGDIEGVARELKRRHVARVQLAADLLSLARAYMHGLVISAAAAIVRAVAGPLLASLVSS